MMTLRPYQQDAVAAIYRHLREQDDNPCCVIPTAGGKTPILATICKDAVGQWNGRVLIVAHVKELLQQAADKLQSVCPEVPFGIYSAGLGSRDVLAPVIIGGVQSVFRRPGELGHFDLAIIDEAHCVPPDGEGMYRTLLAGLKQINPHLRVIGLTATPFRMTSGSICAPENILNSICYEVGVRELIAQSYLCPLKSKAGRQKVDTSGVHIRGGDFIAGELEALMDEDALVQAACKEIVDHTRERNAVLVFATGVRHGNHVAERLTAMGQKVATVFGDTLDFERDQTLADFKAGKIKFLVNVNVLTTGFDAPNIDCVVMLRPTMSPGLYYQMVGRGFRLFPGKQNCLVLDFGGNVLRHGPVDAIRIEEQPEREGSAPVKECPQCQSIIATGFNICPECGFEFPRDTKRHDATASEASVLSGEVTEATYQVLEVRYGVHVKRNAAPDAPRTMRVDYRIGFNRWQSEWICVEHTGYARSKAEQWWSRRSNSPVPANVDEAVALAEAGALSPTKSITVRSVSGEEFKRITQYELGDKPDAVEVPPTSACPNCGCDETELSHGTGPHAARENCSGCGRFIRWVPKAELPTDWQPAEPEPEYVPADDSIPF